MTGQRRDLLARLEDDLLDWTIPVSALLTTCMMLAGGIDSAEVYAWANAELKGYPGRDVPDYRRFAAPIMQVIEAPYAGLHTELLNVHTLPEPVREYITEIVPLNQGAGELESLISQHEARNEDIQLGVFTGDAYVAFMNRNPGRQYNIVAIYWRVSPAVVHGALGRIRTVLAEFVVRLRKEVGDSGQLPSADQATEALRTVVPAVFNNSIITFMTTKEGDIMPDGPRTTIKDNEVKIEGSSGNISVASAHVTQVNAEGMDVEKIREFANLISEISPVLGVDGDQQAELQSGASELREAVSAPTPEKGRIRRALDRVMPVLRGAGSTTARGIAIGMGDELMRQIGGDTLGQLPR